MTSKASRPACSPAEALSGPGRWRRAPFPGGAAAARNPLPAAWEQRAAPGWALPRAGCTCVVSDVLQDLLVGHELHLQGAAALPLRLAHGGHPASTPRSVTWAPPPGSAAATRARRHAAATVGTVPPASPRRPPEGPGLGLLPPFPRRRRLPAAPRGGGGGGRTRKRAHVPDNGRLPEAERGGAGTERRRRALTDLRLDQSATLFSAPPPAGGSGEKPGLPLPAKRAPARRAPGVAVATRSRREPRAGTARARPALLPWQSSPHGPPRPGPAPRFFTGTNTRTTAATRSQLTGSPRQLLPAFHPCPPTRVRECPSYDPLQLYPALHPPPRQCKSKLKKKKEKKKGAIHEVFTSVQKQHNIYLTSLYIYIYILFFLHCRLCRVLYISIYNGLK